MNFPNITYLWMAMLIFASANSVTRKISNLGTQHLIDGRNPISLCNVLFVGNLCAFLVILVLLRRERSPVNDLKKSLEQHWQGMLTVAILAGALAPALIFAALDRTMVINVVLVGRLEPLFILGLATWFGGARVHPLNVVGSAIALVGVGITAFLSSHGGLAFGIGELQVAVASLCLAVANFTSKRELQEVPLHIFNAFRNFVGAIVFFVTAVYLYGLQHFADAATPILWGWMFVYSAVIVVLGQTCWARGLRCATVGEANVVGSCSPIAAILMALLILGEVPSTAQLIGCAVAGVGVVLAFIGTQKTLPPVKNEIVMDVMAGFKGI